MPCHKTSGSNYQELPERLPYPCKLLSHALTIIPLKGFPFTSNRACEKLYCYDQNYREGIAMEKADVAKIQEEFARNISEFSLRFASSWTDTLKRAGITTLADPSLKAVPGWTDPSLLFKLAQSPSVVNTFEDAMKTAAEDLPELLKSTGDPERTRRAADRWTRLCEESVRKMLAIPGDSETRRLLDQWARIASAAAPAGRPSSASAGASFFGMLPSGLGPFSFFQKDQAKLLQSLAESYGRTFGHVFTVPDQAAEFQATCNAALDAQIQFLKSLPEFQERIVSASRKTVEDLIKTIEKLDKPEITPDLLRLFSQMWSASHQRLFQDLFASDSFHRALSDIVQCGIDAATKMEAVMTDWATLGTKSDHKDVGDLEEKVYSMEKRIRLLEREVDDLKRQRPAASSSLQKVDEA
jgi:uncharacterized protein Yka (UPF0111/DUF47 family)